MSGSESSVRFKGRNSCDYTVGVLEYTNVLGGHNVYCDQITLGNNVRRPSWYNGYPALWPRCGRWNTGEQSGGITIERIWDYPAVGNYQIEINADATERDGTTHRAFLYICNDSGDTSWQFFERVGFYRDDLTTEFMTISCETNTIQFNGDTVLKLVAAATGDDFLIKTSGAVEKFHFDASTPTFRVEASATGLCVSVGQNTVDAWNNYGITPSDLYINYYGGTVQVNTNKASTGDFICFGDTVDNLLMVDASADNVGINTATPKHNLQIGSPYDTTGSWGAGTKSMVAEYIVASVDSSGRAILMVATSTHGQMFAYNYGGPAALPLCMQETGSNVTIRGTQVSANYDLGLVGSGVLMLKETTTPTADTNYGKVYTKSGNKLYFQDGAGTEHEVALAT
jgi:hypothetical protein